MIDGLTRAPNVDWEYISTEALSYQPYRGALVLAALTLPLFLSLQRRWGGKIQSLLLWFVFCTVSYTKDFAYIHFPGTPLYVTEVVLVLVVIRRFIWPVLRVPRIHRFATILLAVFLAEGFFQLIRSLDGPRDALCFRDFALTLYPLFVLVGLYVFQDWPAVRRFCICFAMAASLSGVVALFWFLGVPSSVGISLTRPTCWLH